MMAAQPTASLRQALETLARLQAAAPPGTAARLKQVAALLQSLAEENAYLNTLLVENPDAPTTAPRPEPENFGGTRMLSGDPSTAETVEARRVPDPSTAETIETRSLQPNAALESFGDDALMTGVSDAIRPPLVAIRGRAELLQTGLMGHITPDQDQWLQAILENTDRAFATLDALHEIQLLRQGRMSIDWVNFISTDLLTEAWERVRERVRTANHEISVLAPDTVPLAHGDFYQSLKVLSDLLDNAIRYTPPGGSIRLMVDNLGTHVLFSVVDSGIGLTTDDLQYVGQPFWRGEDRLVQAHPGTGLRLYLAKKVLALQGGELIFSGEPGLGSTFSFTLRTPD
jgi:signal transduction histidine kinase